VVARRLAEARREARLEVIGELLEVRDRLTRGLDEARRRLAALRGLRARLGQRPVLAALVEACLGALYLEHRFEPIREPIVAAFRDRIDYALEGHVDYKTELQEELARRGLSVSYSVLEVEGPPHERRFTCAANIDGEEAGVGVGPSKKAAEQSAAREALEKLGVGS